MSDIRFMELGPLMEFAEELRDRLAAGQRPCACRFVSASPAEKETP
jgi:hypothetical protein